MMDEEDRFQALDPVVDTAITISDVICLEDEIQGIFDRKDHYYFMWLLYSIIDKVLVIVNFGTLLICVVIEADELGLILSFFTLSIGVLIDSKEYVILLEKLLLVYNDVILPTVEDYRRSMLVKEEDGGGETKKTAIVLNQMRHVRRVENDSIEKYMGCTFTLPHSLRSVACRKVIVCFFAYVTTFICIPLLYNYLG